MWHKHHVYHDFNDTPKQAPVRLEFFVIDLIAPPFIAVTMSMIIYQYGYYLLCVSPVFIMYSSA